MRLMQAKSWGFLVLALGLGVLATHLLVDHWVSDPPNYDEIEPGLFLGGRVPEPPAGTTAVLNLCEIVDRYRCEFHSWVPIPDAAPSPSLEWLQDQVEWIESHRKRGRTVYVHCFNGVSRSGMVMVAYLMWKYDWTREEAIRFVRARRDRLRPNPVFLERLTEWELKLRTNKTGHIRTLFSSL